MVDTEIRLIIFFAAKDDEALYSQQKQDQEPTVAQTMNSLLPNSVKKVGKTIIPFRYDLNQIPYNYTVEGTGYPFQYSWASLVPQMAKNLPAI